MTVFVATPEKIAFNKPLVLGPESENFSSALAADTNFVQLCEERLECLLQGTEKAFLTPSCTASLEMAAMLAGISPGDEVIMPSFTFVSTANAFALRGARPVFVDIRPDTMNIDENLIESAVSKKTRAIVVVHYNGVGCEMDQIAQVAQKHEVALIEDAAQAIGSSYKGRPLGTIGEIGTISFDHMKNITTGEGGLIAINDPSIVERAHILRDKGTNRSQFLRGMVEKYQWEDVGSNFCMSNFSAAMLWTQLQALDRINARRIEIHDAYANAFSALASGGQIEMQSIPEGCAHNGHLFYIKLRDSETRARLIDHLKGQNISAVFHYVPLHSSPAGKKFGRFAGEDRHTTRESQRLLRLPLYYDLTDSEQGRVIEAVLDFLA